MKTMKDYQNERTLSKKLGYENTEEYRKGLATVKQLLARKTLGERTSAADWLYEGFFDGACWPNPNGHAAGGAFVRLNGEIVFSESRYCGCENTSNNAAEYQGLILILEYFVKEQPKQAIVYGDSDLVIKQMTGEWRAGRLTKSEKSGKVPVRPRYYLPYYETAQQLMRQINGLIEFCWIPREQNDQADLLSRAPLLERGIESPY